MLFRPFIERHFLGSFQESLFPALLWYLMNHSAFLALCHGVCQVAIKDLGYTSLTDSWRDFSRSVPGQDSMPTYRHHNQLCDQDDQTHHHHRAGYGEDNQDKMSIITRMTINLLVSTVSWSFERPAKKNTTFHSKWWSQLSFTGLRTCQRCNTATRIFNGFL